MIKKNPFSVPEEYFERSRAEILSKISGQDESTFFDLQKKSILEKTTQPKAKVLPIRRIISVAVAASVIGLGMFLFQNKAIDQQDSFESMLASTSINEEDLLLEVSEDDFIEYVGDNIAMVSVSDIVVPNDEGNNHLSKENKVDGIKPNLENNSPSFEDIDEDVIIDYLLEDESFDIEI